MTVLRLLICGNLKTEKTYRKLNVDYNNVFRYLFTLPKDAQGWPCSASGMFVKWKLKSFQERLRYVIYKLQCRQSLSHNDIVESTFFDHKIKKSSKLRKLWNRLNSSAGCRGWVIEIIWAKLHPWLYTQLDAFKCKY